MEKGLWMHQITNGAVYAIKEIKFSKGCNMNSIRAKFSYGILFIAMPKEAVTENHFIWG